MSKSTTSKVSSGSKVSSVEESKSGVLPSSGSHRKKKASNSLVGVKHGVSSGAAAARRGTAPKPRVRTLSNSEMSCSQNSVDEHNSGYEN